MPTTKPVKPHSEYKRLIICCDGTWQASDKGSRTVPSNITKFARAIKTAELRDDGQEIQQVVYYQAGVATGSYFSFESTYVGNLGIGLDANVISAYYFLSNNYDPGDEIFLYGFSRGAYTVRCVAALVARFGIIHKSHMDRFPVVYDAYRLRKSDAEFDAAFREMEGQFPTRFDVDIKVLGCWDTVGAMGLPEFWWVDELGLNSGHKFHDVTLHEKVENAFHAIALDEHRAMFTPALWHLPKTTTDGRPMPNLTQCWFPGMHINSGGGSTKNLLSMLSTESAAPGQPVAGFTKEMDMEELADITFGWMVDRSRPFLVFDPEYLTHIVQQHHNWLVQRTYPNPPAFAVGPLKDTYTPYVGALLGGSMARSPGQYDERNRKSSPSFAAQDTNEYFHPCVRARWEALGTKWRPASLGGWTVAFVPEEKNKTQSGWIWSKTLPDGKVLKVPECRVESSGKQSVERMMMGGEALTALGEESLV